MTISPELVYRQRLVVMVKVPQAGRVKTRLGRDIGMTAAAWWFRHQLRRLLREVQDARWQTVLAVAPDTAGLQSRIWPAHLPRIAQGGGDLGARMGRIFKQMPPGPVCIIGGDIPGVRRAHLARAFALVRRNGAVFGPASDGGYWLVGLKRSGPVPADIFANVRWSTPHALADSIASLRGQPAAMADMLQDVDTLADLRNLTARLGAPAKAG